MRSEHGQGTVEYLAVVLLVTVALAGGTAAVATAAGSDIATAVPHQMLRALCIVTGGDCDRDRAACDVGSTTTSSSWSATVAVVRLGHGRVVVVERRSDGSSLVTLTTAPSIGLQTTDGARARIDRGAKQIEVGGAITASVVASLGRGRTWVAPNDAAARALVAAIEHGDPRPADQELRQVDVVPGLSAARSFGRNTGATVSGTATTRGSVGEITDRATGTRTYFLEANADLLLDLTASLGALGTTGATGGGGAAARLALSVDRDGRWRDLALVGTGELAANVSLPRSVGPLADDLRVPTSGGRRWAAEAHLDLSDAGNLAAAQALVAAARSFPPRPAATFDAAREVARRIDDRAVVDLRAYALDRAASGFDVQMGARLGLGVGHERSTETTRLIAASTRGLDGRWQRRNDCLKEART